MEVSLMSTRNVSRTTDLCVPCSVTGHPFPVESVLSVSVRIDLPGGKFPLSLKDWVSEERLNAFQGITEKQHDRFCGFISINGDFLHLPRRSLGEILHAGT